MIWKSWSSFFCEIWYSKSHNITFISLWKIVVIRNSWMFDLSRPSFFNCMCKVRTSGVPTWPFVKSSNFSRKMKNWHIYSRTSTSHHFFLLSIFSKGRSKLSSSGENFPTYPNFRLLIAHQFIPNSNSFLVQRRFV